MGLVRDLLAEILDDCPKCDGTGRDTRGALPPYPGCRPCDGTGSVLTDGGHTLVEALRPHLAEYFAARGHEHGV